MSVILLVCLNTVMYAPKLYEYYKCYVKYPSYDAIPAADRDRIEQKILKDSFPGEESQAENAAYRIQPGKRHSDLHFSAG